MSQPDAKESPKTIAEKYLKLEYSFLSKDIPTLARAFLELEAKHLELEKELVHYKAEWVAHRNEIRTKLYETDKPFQMVSIGRQYGKTSAYVSILQNEIAELKSEIAKLKEENEKYKKVLIKGSEWIEWKFGKPNRLDFERIFIREKKAEK